MARMTKRRKAIAEKIEPGKAYTADEAFALVNELASAKFSESIDVSVNLGVDPRKSDQVVRGSTVLPNGTGKTVRVAVFAQGENAEKATAAGADIVGFEDLAETIKGGEMNFDVVIATPDAMRVVGQLGIIHCAIGKVGFEASALRENLAALLADLKKAKPASAKGAYVKKLTVSSTMGPGVIVDHGSVEA